jgi:hypothetical protein
MRPQLNYVIATDRQAELRRDVEPARLAHEDRVTEATSQREAPGARAAIRLRLRGARPARLRVRRT